MFYPTQDLGVETSNIICCQRASEAEAIILLPLGVSIPDFALAGNVFPLPTQSGEYPNEVFYGRDPNHEHRSRPSDPG